MAANLTRDELHNVVATNKGKLDAANAVPLCCTYEVYARVVTAHLKAALVIHTYLIDDLTERLLKLGETEGLVEIKDSDIAI